MLATDATGRNVSINGRNTQGSLKVDTSASPIADNPGVRITVHDGQTLHSLTTTEFDHTKLEPRIRNLCLALGNRGRVSRESFGASINRHFETAVQEDPNKVSLREILEKNNYILNILANPNGDVSRYVTSARVGLTENTSHKVFADPARVLSQTLHGITLFSSVSAKRDGIYRQGYDIIGGTDFTTVRNAQDAFFADLARKAVSYLFSKRLKPGYYNVVISPQVAGIFAHESFGHGYEADKVVLGLAAAGSHIGKEVGSSLVNIADYPGLPKDIVSTTAGKYFFDDEGNIVQEPTLLVRDGILQPTPITDKASYEALRHTISGIRSTPNARLQSIDREIYARMSQTYFMPDPIKGLTFEQMIESIDEGVYLDRAYGGIEDPLGWGIQVAPIIGYHIKNGKLTGEVYYGLSATGTVPEFLKSIDAVGKTLEMTPGLCGKGKKEIVDVGTGGTHLRGRIHLS